jgi:hypothetical protein
MMATITAEMLRDLLRRARDAGGGPELDIVAHPDRAREFHALPEMIPLISEIIRPQDLFLRVHLTAVPPKHRIGVFEGSSVWVDPDCPRDNVYALPWAEVW